MLTSLEWQTLEQQRRILVGVANLLLEDSPELLYGAGPNCGVW
jgi:hypothetical protein